MLTIDHIMRMYDRQCSYCRHLKKGRKQCPVLQTLKQDPNAPTLQGRIKDAGMGRAQCPYWEAKVTETTA